MRRVTAVLGAGLIVLGLACLPVSPASATLLSTTVTMNVTGCEGCTITPSQYRKGMVEPWSGAAAKVTGGVATFVVPTASTSGMVFAIDATWKVEINAQPLIAFQYQGAPVGGTLTRAQAIAAKRGSACWAGTMADVATLNVTVRRVRMPAFPPTAHHTTQVPLAYVVPTPKSPGGFGPAYKGVLATQDVWTCP